MIPEWKEILPLMARFTSNWLWFKPVSENFCSQKYTECSWQEAASISPRWLWALIVERGSGDTADKRITKGRRGYFRKICHWRGERSKGRLRHRPLRATGQGRARMSSRCSTNSIDHRCTSCKREIRKKHRPEWRQRLDLVRRGSDSAMAQWARSNKKRTENQWRWFRSWRCHHVPKRSCRVLSRKLRSRDSIFHWTQFSTGLNF